MIGNCLVPPSPFISTNNEIFVWRIVLPEFIDIYSECLNILSQDEQTRCSKFLFEKDRIRFILSHWALRCILANILNVAPASLQFTQNPYGKPELAGQFLNSPIRFNLSHSGDIALIVISYNIEIGIDIEQILTDFEFEEIARYNFTLEENAVLQSTSVANRSEVFYRIWTGKEAFIKAKGLGLSIPLDTFSIIPVSDSPTNILKYNNPQGSTQEWSILSLQPFPGYNAALAGNFESICMKCIQFHSFTAPRKSP